MKPWEPESRRRRQGRGGCGSRGRCSETETVGPGGKGIQVGGLQREGGGSGASWGVISGFPIAKDLG